MLTNRIRTFLASRGGLAASIQTLLTNVLILGLNLLTGIITARILGPSGRGEQAAIVMWPQFLPVVFSFGLPHALIYNLRLYPARASNVFSATLLLATGTGLLATIVGVVFIPYWLSEYSAEVVPFAQWVMLTAPLFSLSLIVTAGLWAREEFAFNNTLRCLTPLLTLLALGLLALNQGLTPFTAVLAYLLPGALVCLWGLVRLWRFYQPLWQGLGSAYKRLTSYGVRSYGVELLGVLGRQLDQVLVVGLLSPAMMGTYVVALSLSRMLGVFQDAAVSVLLPKASGRSVEEVAALTGRVMRAITTLTLFGAIGFALFGPWALRLLYGQDFLGAVTVLRLLLFEVMFGSAYWVLAQAFMAVGRPGIVTLLQGIGLGLAVALLFMLVPRYGIEGAGLALLISTAARLALVTISFPLILKVRVPRLWPTKTDFAIIISAFSERKSLD